MRENRSARRIDETRVEPGIGIGDDVGDVARLLADEPQDLLLPLHAVPHEPANILLRVGHGRAVRGILAYQNISPWRLRKQRLTSRDMH